MSVNEVSMGLQFLSSRLSADSTLAGLAPGGVKRFAAPAGTATPFIIIGYQTGKDVTTLNGVRVMDDILYLAKVVGEASKTQAVVDASSQLDVVLGGTQGLRNIAVTGGWLLACYRQVPVQFDEPVAQSSIIWSHSGGLYRIELQQV